MCDTMGFFHEGSAIFAKNSDRSPNEPQVLEYIPAKDHEETELKVTYTTIPQVPHTKAVLISRPVWLWGAEMGVNEDGVCIGNEAVFTKGAYHKENNTLIGMDYLRLALERASTAKEAVDVITELLPVYGQGGNCAYDHKFYYDNSYLIMDRHHIFILETADKEWTCEEVDRGSISNRLSQDKAFARKHKDPVYSTFSGSGDRLKQSSTCLVGATSVQDMMKALRRRGNRELGLHALRRRCGRPLYLEHDRRTERRHRGLGHRHVHTLRVPFQAVPFWRCTYHPHLRRKRPGRRSLLAQCRTLPSYAPLP